MNDNELQMVLVIIGGYGIAAMFWFIMAYANIKWGNPYSFAGMGMAILWIWYAFRNFDFFFNKSLYIDQEGLWYNCMGVLFLDVCSFYLTKPYFKHVRNRISLILKTLY